MTDLLELAAEYRKCGVACKKTLATLVESLKKENLKPNEEIETRRRITLVTAMARECLATSNYLVKYYERRQILEERRKETGV